MIKIPIVVISGATASGKTSLSIELAKRYNGEIISADSMQIYKKMNIGTAKPDETERMGIVHHMMDFVDPKDNFSVADYVSLAHEKIEDIRRRGKLPIIVGGTGLYIDSLVKDIDFIETTEDSRIRQELIEISEKEGAERLYSMLEEIDPEIAKQIPMNNVRKVARAIEFYKVTGITMTENNKRTREKKSRYIPLEMAISWDREKLYKRIDMRVDIMIKNGLTDEVEALMRDGLDSKSQSMQGIGYRQIIDYFNKKTSLDEAVEIIKRDSRRYAKRQLTWFRRNENIHWLDAKEDIFKEAYGLVDEFLAQNQQNL